MQRDWLLFGNVVQMVLGVQVWRRFYVVMVQDELGRGQRVLCPLVEGRWLLSANLRLPHLALLLFSPLA